MKMRDRTNVSLPSGCPAQQGRRGSAWTVRYTTSILMMETERVSEMLFFNLA